MPRDDRTFITVHDGIDEHPKIEGLSDAAFRLLISTWAWCSRNRTDGNVRAASWAKRGKPRVRAELLAAGLAELQDNGDVQMHDYLQHQRSAAEIDELSQKRSEAGKKGGKARANALANAKQVPDGSEGQNRSLSGNGRYISTSRDSMDDASFRGMQPSNHGDSPVAKGKQTASKSVAETDTETELLTTSQGSPPVPAGFVPRVVRAYVESARDAGNVAPEDSQRKVDRSARKLLAEGFSLDAVIDAARNAAAGGWTDLATQLQRDAARAQPPPGARPSTTDQRAQAALTLADHLDRKAIG